MKTLFITIASLISFGTFAQSSIWAKSTNISEVIHSVEFTHFTNEMNVKITRPLSNSRNPELQNVYQIEANCDAADLYAAMHKVPGLTGIEYGEEYNELSQPNDYTATFTTNWALDLIEAQGAWDITTGSSEVNIAVSDMNFDINHEELQGKINYYNENNTLNKNHGTAVAIIAAGNTNNEVGLSSIGYNSSLSLYRMNYNQVLQASYDGTKVINMSWASSCNFNPYVQAALTEVYNNGTFLVASAGNGGTCGGADNLVYPAAYEHVFAVTSIGAQDNIERTIGNPTTRHQTNSSVDICAPGFDVPLTVAPGWYLTGNGTSFAAPYVTGTVGLMLAANPDITNDEIDSILRATATNINELNPNYIGKIGSGRLNSRAAVALAYNLTIVADTGDGNNGHGNDEDGWDDSNPGQGGNYGNNGNGNVQDKPNKANDSTTIKLAFAGELPTYDMNGKEVNLQNAPSGMYLVIKNGIITKIVK
jgi:subtilisin family serine protease